jgi:hypothetical protein
MGFEVSFSLEFRHLLYSTQATVHSTECCRQRLELDQPMGEIQGMQGCFSISAAQVCLEPQRRCGCSHRGGPEMYRVEVAKVRMAKGENSGAPC